MRDRSGTVVRLAAPIRALTQRFAFLFLVFAAFGLMLLGKAETVLMERLRTGVVDVVSPIMDAASHPIATVSNMVDNVDRLVALHDENGRLRAQNARLLEWQTAAHKLAAENESLRKLLNFVPPPRARYATARVIAHAGGAFARTVLINAGARDGLVEEQAVVTGSGLVGRVVSVGDGSARVLLVTDLNSRIPIVFEDTRERAILAGDNSDTPRIVFLSRGAEVAPDARITTSGDGGVFPSGIPVGVVSSVDDGDVKVRLFARPEQLEYVRVIDFQATTSSPEATDGAADAFPELGP